MAKKYHVIIYYKDGSFEQFTCDAIDLRTGKGGFDFYDVGAAVPHGPSGCEEDVFKIIVTSGTFGTEIQK